MLKNASELKEKGNALFKENFFAEAINEYVAGLALEPTDQSLRLGLHLNAAHCLMRLGRFAEAESHLGKVLSTSPLNVKGLYRLALCLRHRGDFAGALQCVEKIDPRSRDAEVRALISSLKKPFFVRDTPKKGKGMFAKQKVAAGTCVLREVPVVFSVRYSALNDDFKMSRSSQDMIEKIQRNENRDVDGVVAVVICLIVENKHEVFVQSHQSTLQSKFELWANVLEKYLKISASHICEIIRCVESNVFNFDSPHISCRGAGLFDEASYFNHRCFLPNCEWVASPHGISVVAVKDIDADEELTISYTGTSFLTWKTHGSQMNFPCCCQDCEKMEAVKTPVNYDATSKMIRDASNVDVGRVFARALDNIPFPLWMFEFLSQLGSRVFNMRTPVLDDFALWPDFTALYDVREKLWTELERIFSPYPFFRAFLISEVTCGIFFGCKTQKDFRDGAFLEKYFAFPNAIGDDATKLFYWRASCYYSVMRSL